MSSYVFKVSLQGADYSKTITERSIVASTAEKAIERAKILYRKHNTRWHTPCVTFLERGQEVFL